MPDQYTVIDDLDGAEAAVRITTDNNVQLHVGPFGLAFFDVNGARALARALEDLADEADCRQIEAIS